jgi:hypothetical protein
MIKNKNNNGVKRYPEARKRFGQNFFTRPKGVIDKYRRRIWSKPGQHLALKLVFLVSDSLDLIITAW